VRLAREFHPEVVLSDIGLPKLDGFGVARALRGSGARLIAITAYGEDEYIRRAQESGFSLVLVKPADPQALVQLLG
jgi:CheY-like chemotaxis protein